MKRKKSKGGKIGILTFQCSDNYGALLQAYALRTWLRSHSYEADIVPYAPFYMTSRHWLIPMEPWLDRNHVVRTIKRGIRIARRNLPILPEILKQKKRMRSFREKNLGLPRHKFRWEWQLRNLRYRMYIVGSDQIWNPFITNGLRGSYFGAFAGRHERVISYSASMGASETPPEYAEEFTRLIRRLDAVSVREKEAVPFVRKMSGKEAETVPDPVLLLDAGQWEQAESPCLLSDDFRYVLFHATGRNEEMIEYAGTLAAQKGLPVIELCYRREGHITDFSPVYSAGPGEFLAYIRKAEYVVTNSFHGLAMSILYGKQFAAFLYTERDARIRELLDTTGLRGRLYGKGNGYDIDEPIDWETVYRNIDCAKRKAEDFLNRNLEA